MTGNTVRILIIAMWGAVVLSGCIGGDDLASDGEEGAEAPRELRLGANEALLEGTVFNDGLEPVEGANVIVRATGVNATTNENGRYVLQGLEPGEQAIIVEASGHAALVEQVDVLAGTPTGKDFMIQRVRGANPYTELRQQVGLLECQVGLVVLLANCIPIQNVLNTVGTNPTATKQIHKWEIEPVEGLQAIVLEMVWQPSGLTTAQEMVFLVEEDGDGLGGGTWGRVQGPSVIKYVITEDTVVSEEKVLEGMKEAAGNGEPYQTRVFPPNSLGNLVYQQTFEVFASHFYYSVPSDGYSAVPEDYAP